MNAGQKTIEWLRDEQLQVDDEWSVDTSKGFTWWAFKNAQTIEVVGSEAGPDGNDGHFVRVKTEVWRNVELTSQALSVISLLMSTASMAGPVYDAEKRILSFASMVRVHEGIWEWMARLISISAMMQIQDAHFLGSQMAPALDAETAESNHPTSGSRDEPDEITLGFTPMLASAGEERSKWAAAEFQKAVDQYMQQPPSLMASGGGNGLTVEFPFGDFSSLCQFQGDQAHPRIGNGLLILQRFPVGEMSESEGVDLALKLNAQELNQKPIGYGFGSYCYQDGCICFNGFVPNLAYRAGLLPNIYFACAGRAQAMSARFTANDWSQGVTPSAPEKPRSALRRFLERFGNA